MKRRAGRDRFADERGIERRPRHDGSPARDSEPNGAAGGGQRDFVERLGDKIAEQMSEADSLEQRRAGRV